MQNIILITCLNKSFLTVVWHTIMFEFHVSGVGTFFEQRQKRRQVLQFHYLTVMFFKNIHTCLV
jgi:hypothetical protein